jgi:hypothetical protein
MYSIKAVASSVFRTMMFTHNKKIITIDQISHYEPNRSTNIDNILPLVFTSSNAYSLIDMGPKIFKDPSLLGFYHGTPPLIHPSTQVCVIYSNGTDIGDTIPSTEASPHLNVPLFEEIIPQGLPENYTTPLMLDFPLPQGKIPVWEIIHQAITQIPFFYPPIRSPSISGSHDSYPSQHGGRDSYMVSIPTFDGSSTISPSSVRGYPNAYSNTNSSHATLTPNFQHHFHS